MYCKMQGSIFAITLRVKDGPTCYVTRTTYDFEAPQRINQRNYNAYLDNNSVVTNANGVVRDICRQLTPGIQAQLYVTFWADKGEQCTITNHIDSRYGYELQFCVFDDMLAAWSSAGYEYREGEV